jgi:two-component system CheB/CheR fusion protein
MLESVFELFVQSRRTLDRAAGGLGVGLSLVRSLVAMHGGKVTAHSEGEGTGSELVVRLPIAGAERASLAPSLQDAVPPAYGMPAGSRVLVVEDNADSREMLCELLTLSGLHCRGAENGLAALALLDEMRPEAALIDLGLPGIDGFELARRIRARPGSAGMCLIALTGYGQPSDRALGREVGFDAHLVKPVRVDQLLVVLGQLRGARSRRVEAQDGVSSTAPPSGQS